MDLMPTSQVLGRQFRDRIRTRILTFNFYPAPDLT
jgi:hypothetical protein